MRKFLILPIICITLVNCKDTPQSTVETAALETEDTAPNFGIVIHGGAGTILKEYMTPEKEAMYTAALKEAVTAGHQILENGGSSLDAVVAAITIMEDSPLFNAGKGAVFTNEAKNELDASIMDGSTLNAGAAAGVTTVKNPITLARAIMEKSQHVMLAREGAEFFATQNELTIVDPSYFHTEAKMNSLERAKKEEKVELDHDGEKTAFYDPAIKGDKFGTVGCAALDKDGNLASGTSTGGMTNKKWGRIGDSPIIGAGTYANNKTCAVSSTGWGEFFIRNVVAYDISALMEYKGLSVQEAAKEVVQNKLTTLAGKDGIGGIIAIDKDGNVAMEFSTPGMYRATMNKDGEQTIKFYKE